MPCKYHPASCRAVVPQNAPVFLEHPTGVFLDEAEPAILPGGSGPLHVPHRRTPHEDFRAAAEKKNFDNRARFQIDAAFAEKAVCADVFRRGEQVESLAARARSDQFQNDFEANSMVAPGFVVRTVDRFVDGGLELLEVERFLEEISGAEVEAKLAMLVGGLPRDDEDG